MNEDREQPKDEQAEQPDTRISDALAATLELDVSRVRGWSAIVEYEVEEGVTIRTLWSGGVTPWQVRGYAAEMVRHAGTLG